MVLPYWTGALTPYWDHDARGVILGLTGIHGKSHVYRALLEGIAFEQRLLTDGLAAVVSDPIERLVVLGGGSRSSVWCQIISNVLQRPVDVVREPESTCLGAGMLAAPKEKRGGMNICPMQNQPLHFLQMYWTLWM